MAQVYSSTGQLIDEKDPNYNIYKAQNNPSPSSTITADSLRQESPINVNFPNELPIYDITKLNAEPPKMELTQPEQEAQGLSDQIRALNDQLLGESSYRAEQEKAQNIESLMKTQTDLSARLKAIQNEAQSIPLQLQQDATGRGITAGGLAPIQSAALRNNAVQALSTSSLLEASRGNLTTALALVDRAVAQKFDPIKEGINAKTKNLEMILKSPAYSLADKNRASAMQAQLEAQKSAIAKQEEDEKTIMSTATEAAKNGADALTLQKISQAGSPAEALQLASPYLGIGTKQEQQKQEFDNQLAIVKANLESDKFNYQQKQDSIENAINSDKFSWQQKIDIINTQLNSDKFRFDQSKEARDYNLKLKQYALDIKKAENANTPEKYKEWQLAGGQNSGKSFAEFLMSGSDKPATADQQKNAGYALRMQDSNSIINSLTNQWKKLGLLGQTWQSKAPSWLKSSQGQMLEQAERDFVNAVLRRESGAVISQPEFDNAKKQYFPQPGDKDDVIKQKERNRINALKGIVNSSGNALSSEFRDSIGKTIYPDLQTYIDTNPDQVDYIKEIKNTYPEWSPDDVLQFLQSQEDFSMVGGDTNKALQKISIGNKNITVDKSIAERLAMANAEMKKETGKEIQVNQSYRTTQQQAELYNRLSKKGAQVAPPGKSYHEKGLAIDVTNWKEAEKYLRKYGLLNNLKNDKGHFSYGEFA